jgi:hypothetical protein
MPRTRERSLVEIVSGKLKEFSGRACQTEYTRYPHRKFYEEFAKIKITLRASL